MRWNVAVAAFLAMLPSVEAQPIRYLADKQLWVLESGESSYVVGVNELNRLQHVYWGKKLPRNEDFAPARSARDFAFESREGMTTEEYPGWGGMRFYEPCLKVTREDGVRDVALKYVSHEIRGETLEIRLRDINDDIHVTLVYRVWPRTGIIGRHAVIHNGTKQQVVVESA